MRRPYETLRRMPFPERVAILRAVRSSLDRQALPAISRRLVRRYWLQKLCKEVTS